ncbi:TPA: DNA methyltransferase [Enterococcus faecalis]
MDQGSLFEEENKSVECLGMTFKNDDERREYFRNELRKKLPDLKDIEGFPIGEDEDIIELSDPPYYTACPNPWVKSISKLWKNEKINRQKAPYTADVSEGKREPIYNVHTYHTKVPPKAIMRYILHYTEPGDLILDGFSGTGMTGVAASYCGNEGKVKELGYQVDENGRIFESNQLIGELGVRKTILGDLSPQATFMASTLNSPMYNSQFVEEATKLISELEDEYSWLYETVKNGQKYKVNFYVWSDVFSCPNCQNDFVFYDVASDSTGKVHQEFECPNCSAILNKRKLNRVFEKKYDTVFNKFIDVAKQELIFVNYETTNGKVQSRVDESDLDLLNKIESFDIHDWYPKNKFPIGYNTKQPLRSHGIEYISQIFFKRELIILSAFNSRISKYQNSKFLRLLFTSQLINVSKLNRYRPEVSFPYNPLNGTLYIGSLVNESNVLDAYKNKVKRFDKAFIIDRNNTLITTGSSTLLDVEPNSVDYIFTDPPFGANIMYSELSSIWESWNKVLTENNSEAIINPVQKKEYEEYVNLLTEVFKQYYLALKPGKWMTVEFSNSKASIWNAIQSAIQKSGFIIANVSALDKKQGSFKAVTSVVAVKQDLVITAYKPLDKHVASIKSNNGDELSAWNFVSQHLETLPTYSTDFISERTPRILFDRMVAYHIENNLLIPISSGQFQEKVAQKYVMRDGMVFLESQVAEYDKKRILAKEFSQQSLFVSDESSAIEWLRQQLMKKPQSRQDLHPQFMKEIQHIAKHEELPELDNLLVENFLLYDSEDFVPDQIAAYLRKNYHDMRGLENQDDKLKSKAKNRWYVPDPNKQADLEKLREKSLLREFNHYVEEVSGTKKKLKLFRSEAIRAGFKQAWSEKDYQKIVDVAEYLPEKIIQEDDKLLMFHTHALMRLDI